MNASPDPRTFDQQMTLTEQTGHEGHRADEGKEGHEDTSMMGRLEAARAQWNALIGERGRHACPLCDETFARAGYLLLHKGRRHPESLGQDELARYEATEQAERGVMHELALHTKSALFALPLFLVWAATLVLLIEMDANIAWIVLSTPGYALFAGLVYVMAYGYQTGGKHSYYGRS